MPIRVLSETDVNAYRALRLEMLRGEPGAFGRSAEEFGARRLQRVAEQLRPGPERFTLGAFEGERLLGVATFVREAGLKTRHKGNVYGVYVTPAARGRGLAGQLLAELIGRARQLPGLAVLMLAVSEPQAAARALYARLGFTVWGREPDALRVGGEAIPELHLRLEL